MPAATIMPRSLMTNPSEWFPTVKGIPYQLTLKNGVFGFCDDRGSWQFDVATGKQASGARHCDIDHEEEQSSCDDSIQIWGSPEGGDDHISVGYNNYLLKGHDRACDKDGQTVIAATIGAVEVIDGVANKVAIVDPGGGDRAVIGSGWIAWSTLDEKRPLRLETLSRAMEHAKTPK